MIMSKIEDEEILDTFSHRTFSDDDLFFGKGTEENRKRQKEAIELYHWKKKMNRANRMKSKKKRKQYKEILNGLRRV